MLFDHKLAWENEEIYKEIYKNSIENPNAFWNYHSKDFYWKKEPICSFDSKKDQWLPGGISTVCYNCVDRHAKNFPYKPAIVWYGDEKGERKEVSYSELQNTVIKIASILKSEGAQKGDVIAIYMPMVPETIAAMLACSRIGTLHLVVFAGFSPEALAYRLEASKAKLLLTVTSSRRGGKKIDILNNANIAVSKIKHSCKILNLDNLQNFAVITNNEICWQNNQDNLFILYTSGSSGNPKGIVHSALPYLLYTSTTFKVIFGINPSDIYFATSDIGWITGHSYITYAPLFHGLTVVIFEGTPTYPDADRYWEIIENEKVSIFYSAPTAIRSLQIFDDKLVKKHDLSSLRVLGSVGEPINKSAWEWYFNVVGNKQCPIMDTWWQTETGGIILAPLRTLNQKPCIAGKPFFGNITKITDNEGNVITSPNSSGNLVIKNNWPGRYSSIIGEHNNPNNLTCYFKNESFTTGDGAIYDIDFDIKIIGRLDDVINISGHRLGTAEFECAINKVEGVRESAVVAVDHNIKGQTAFAYVVSYENADQNQIIANLLKSTKQHIGPIAKPDFVVFVPDLPKTRSGKIVRHLLRDIANNHNCNEKDISSVCNQEILPIIYKNSQKPFFCPDICKMKN